MSDTKPAWNQVPLTCRIEESRQYNQKFYTRVTTPAPDEFSMPSQFELRSDQQIGSIGSSVQVLCSLSGFTKSRQYTDRQTGELRQVLDKTTYLDVIKVG